MTFSEGNLLRINQSMWFFYPFICQWSVSCCHQYLSHSTPTFEWEWGGKRGKGWSWGLTSSLDNCPSFDDVLTKVSSHPPTSLIRCLFIYLFRFTIVKFVVKIFLQYLIPLNPSVSSDSTSPSSSPHPHPCCCHPHPHPFPLLIRGIFASEGHWEQQADLCPKPTFAYEYD